MICFVPERRLELNDKIFEMTREILSFFWYNRFMKYGNGDIYEG